MAAVSACGHRCCVLDLNFPSDNVVSQLMIVHSVPHQIATLAPEDRVLVIGESANPQTCIKNDEVALMSFFRRLHYIPLPDHGGRRVRQIIINSNFAYERANLSQKRCCPAGTPTYDHDSPCL